MAARSIPTSELRAADILVTTGRGFISGGIRTATGTDYSHAILYIGDGKVIEAIDQGVVERDLSLALAEATLAVALRRRFMNDAAQKLVVQMARKFLGRPYDYVGAAGAGLAHNRGKAACASMPGPCLALYVAAQVNASPQNRDKKFFCSELAARCYEIAGVPITDDPSFTTPRTVRVSESLLYVGHLLGG